MKKFLGILLTGMLLVTTAFAEDIDLSSLSLDELTLLQQRVSAEIASKVPEAGDLLPEGVYTVGEDLKPGKYIFTVTRVRRRSDGTSDGDAYVLNASGSYVLYSYNIEPGESLFFSLSEGMTVQISACSGLLSPATQSWVAD